MINRVTYEALDMVRDFHMANNQRIGVLPPTSEPVPVATFNLRTRLIFEELGETSAAIQEHNLLELADGLADLLYVVLGSGVAYGLPVEDHWPDLQKEALGGPFPDEKKARTMLMLARQCNYAIGAMFNCSAICQCDDLTCKARTVPEELWTEALEQLKDAAAAIGAAAEAYGIPLREIFKEVHRSNMTKKLGTSKEGQKYGEGGGKAEGYEPPRIADLLDQHGLLARQVEGDQARGDQQ